MLSHPDLQSLSRLRAPKAREDWLLHHASSATSAFLRLLWYQVTSFKVPFSAGSAHRAASFPGRVGPSLRHVSVLLMLFTYLVEGAPRAASSPSCSGLAQRHLLFLRLVKMICSFALNCHLLLNADFSAFMQSACTLKGGYLSIATHGLLLALQPSPPGLDPQHRDLSYQRRLSSLEGRDLRI